MYKHRHNSLILVVSTSLNFGGKFKGLIYFCQLFPFLFNTIKITTQNLVKSHIMVEIKLTESIFPSNCYFRFIEFYETFPVAASVDF